MEFVSETINLLSSVLLFTEEFHFPVVVRELELGPQEHGSYPSLLVVPAEAELGSCCVDRVRN